VLRYNELDKVRHNLYKKRSARLLSRARKILAERYNNEKYKWHVALKEAEKTTYWTAEDRIALHLARRKVKEFGVTLSDMLKKHNLAAVRATGCNRIIQVIENETGDAVWKAVSTNTFVY
jgi:hypothetical protein